MRSLVSILVLVAALAAPAAAQPAVTPATQGADSAPPARYWWKMLLLDGAGLGLAAATESEEIAIGVFLGAGPVVHLAHDNVRGALGSVALRATIPVAAGLVGALLEDCSRLVDGPCGYDGFQTGLFLGMGAALLVDYAWLARRRPGPAAAPTGAGAAPRFVVRADGVIVGLGGRF